VSCAKWLKQFKVQYNNNNNPICKTPECQQTSMAWDAESGGPGNLYYMGM